MAYYEQWERVFGDIPNRLRPLSLLQFRKAECRYQLGQLDAAASGFRSVMQPDSLDKERYELGMSNLVGDYDPEEDGFGTEGARRYSHYFLNRGLNSFCRLRLQQISVKLQAARRPE